jgi:hypothetical protein
VSWIATLDKSQQDLISKTKYKTKGLEYVAKLILGFKPQERH